VADAGARLAFRLPFRTPAERGDSTPVGRAMVVAVVDGLFFDQLRGRIECPAWIAAHPGRDGAAFTNGLGRLQRGLSWLRRAGGPERPRVLSDRRSQRRS